MVVLVQLVVLNMVMPTIDTFSDIYLFCKLVTNHARWAVAVISPVVANLAFTVAAWHRAPPWHHSTWDWVMLALQVTCRYHILEN